MPPAKDREDVKYKIVCGKTSCAFLPSISVWDIGIEEGDFTIKRHEFSDDFDKTDFD